MSDSKIKKMILASMFAAVICVMTLIVRFQLPTGYVNLGDCFVLVAGWALGPIYGTLAAAIGSSLADLISGYPFYAVPTFVVKGLMAAIAFAAVKIALKAKVRHISIAHIIGAVCAEIIMVGGYFIFEAIVFSSALAVQGLVGNTVQGVVGVVAGSVVISVIKKYNLHNI